MMDGHSKLLLLKCSIAMRGLREMYLLLLLETRAQMRGKWTSRMIRKYCVKWISLRCLRLSLHLLLYFRRTQPDGKASFWPLEKSDMECQDYRSVPHAPIVLSLTLPTSFSSFHAITTGIDLICLEHLDLSNGKYPMA